MAMLTGFDHLYLEDSYFLGFGVIDGSVELRALFVLTRDHPSYEPPLAGEQHCYHEGSIRIVGFKPLNVRQAAQPSVLHDPDGSPDLGGIEVSADADSYRITTEWFDMRFEAANVTAALHSNVC
jgi:hypothetical protein